MPKLGFEPQISSFTYWHPTIEQLRHRYQFRIRVALFRIVNASITFSQSWVEISEEGLILSWYLCLSDSMVERQCIKLEI